LRVPNRFFGVRDLAYLKTGFGILEGRGREIRDYNYEWDTGLSGGFFDARFRKCYCKEPVSGNEKSKIF